MMNKTIILNLFFLLFLSACGGERENDAVKVTEDSLGRALEESVDKKIVPTTEEFSLRVSQFNASADGFCNATDENKLSVLQESWRSLSSQWYKLAIYNFGPVNDDVVFPKIIFIDSLRLRGTDYTETVRTTITNMNSSADTLDETFFDSLTFQKVGLLALELLVFETASSEHSVSSIDIVAEYQNLPRKCEILQGMAKQIEKHATYIRDGWLLIHKNTGKPFRTVFLNNELQDGTEPLAALIVSVQSHLDYLQKRNVATVAAQIADYSWESITASIDEIDVLLNGTNDTTISFFSLMESAGFENAVELVKDNISTVRQTIQDRDAALLEIVLGKLDGNFKREIPSGLKVELGINFTDGD